MKQSRILVSFVLAIVATIGCSNQPPVNNVSQNNTDSPDGANQPSKTPSNEPKQPKDFSTQATAKTVEEVVNQYVSAWNDQDYEASCVFYAEPWQSIRQRNIELAEEVANVHKKFQSTLNEHFAPIANDQRPAFGNKPVDEFFTGLTEWKFGSEELEIHSAKVVKNESYEPKQPFQNIDGKPIEVDEIRSLFVEMTASHKGRPTTLRRPFAAMKVGDYWKIVEGELIFDSKDPIAEATQSLDELRSILVDYQLAIQEVKAGLYDSRDQAERVMVLAYATRFANEDLHNAIFEKDQPENVDATIANSLMVNLQSKKHKTRETWLNGQRHRETALTSPLKELVAKSKSRGRELDNLEIYVAPATTADMLRTVLASVLDADYELDKIVFLIDEKHFSKEDLARLTGDFKGRMRIFATPLCRHSPIYGTDSPIIEDVDFGITPVIDPTETNPGEIRNLSDIPSPIPNDALEPTKKENSPSFDTPKK